jgi:hypothetical protein
MNPQVNRWYRMYQDKQFADISLVCDDKKEFRVHKCVLVSSGAAYFERLFNSEWKESTTGVIQAPAGVSSRGMELFIIYMYTSAINCSHASQYYLELLEIAEYFQYLEFKGYLHTQIRAWFFPKLSGTAVSNIPVSTEKFNPYVKWVSANGDEALEDILVQYFVQYSSEFCKQQYPFHELGSLSNKIIVAMSQKIDRLDPGRNNQVAGGFTFGGSQQPRETPIPPPFGGTPRSAKIGFSTIISQEFL